MSRSKVKEFHFITHVDNLPSIMKKGILCNNRMKKEKHHSIALPVIQEKRDHVKLSTGKELHDYANLYFHARNPMMYKRREEHAKICILQIKPEILDVPGIMVSDR